MSARFEANPHNVVLYPRTIGYGPATLPVTIDETVAIPPFGLDGRLVMPVHANAVVLFAHGSGGSRHSPRNKFVASALARAGYGTLLFDLLTPVEAEDPAYPFDIDLLAERLIAATNWLVDHMEGPPPKIGYFGANTGAAAALVAAARKSDIVQAIVCRGGRPDLAKAYLPQVTAPTLFVVGGNDGDVLALNRQAMAPMIAKTSLKVIPDAGHLFDEFGALDQVIDCALFWFRQHLNANETTHI